VRWCGVFLDEMRYAAILTTVGAAIVAVNAALAAEAGHGASWNRSLSGGAEDVLGNPHAEPAEASSELDLHVKT
jgi:hypothetical protein